MIYDEEDYKQLIAESLYDNNIINKDIYLKCSKPKYIQSLPGDLRTNDSELLSNRLDAIQKEEDKLDKEYAKKYNEYEKFKEDRKVLSDEILDYSESILDSVDTLKKAIYEKGEDYLASEAYDHPEVDELNSLGNELYNLLVNDSKIFNKFDKEIRNKVSGENDVNVDFNSIEDRIDEIESLWNDVKKYYHMNLSKSINNLKDTFNEGIMSDFPDWERHNTKVQSLEGDLETIRKKQHDFRDEYDKTMMRLTQIES